MYNIKSYKNADLLLNFQSLVQNKDAANVVGHFN